MQEKRKLKRWHLIYYLRVRDRHTDKPIGHLIDISEGGMMLVSEAPIAVGRVFQFQMMLPEEIAGTTTWEFDAKSLWSQPDFNPSLYKTGFQLLNVIPEDIGTIECLIDDYGFRD
ncbi:MAG: PilZ domain-containing protein [Hydrococcus sp. C42_A2020_068]|uniref:PilZ domain-containing protein n=1 Tax=Pleurocapsa sp. PCC 7327 TaxID=118163 RepID=UPI00029F87C5|nr:PilZ domain-containing protein [Pleurocapsa sp. PCC 7327]AFY78482.1 PilZ domain-containing protein [Pleurocapsa sp. PCC 7327]MBF2022319.1 PilZ domain-containing protein [Hydrococcus sp. C42_A2020_068]